jgi:hypothetical protein
VTRERRERKKKMNVKGKKVFTLGENKGQGMK